MILSIVLCLIFSEFPVHSQKHDDLKKPLFLTPYVISGSPEEAQNDSRVIMKQFPNVKSYSGFFTVGDVAYNKNLFTWFFPSENSEKDPVLLWLNGGPGLSSLFGLFGEIGPFEVVDGHPRLRKYRWTKTHNILFIDSPVGTGYSFTDDQGSYAVNSNQVGDDLLSALHQFFVLFPQYRFNDFFVTGESYAGKYIPILCHKIWLSNQNVPPEKRIYLEGSAIGNGWVDPLNQMDSGNYAFQIGLVDHDTKERMNHIRDKATELFHENELIQSTLVQRNITTVFRNASGFLNMYNYLHPEKQYLQSEVLDFVQTNEIREAIHVGNLTFHTDDLVDHYLLGDIMLSAADDLSYILENKPVLIYSGQLDLAVPYPTTVKYLENLNFVGADEYQKATRKILYDDNKVVGYVKTGGNLKETVLLNAGHLVPVDQPKLAYEMIYAFTRNITIPR